MEPPIISKAPVHFKEGSGSTPGAGALGFHCPGSGLRGDLEHDVLSCAANGEGTTPEA